MPLSGPLNDPVEAHAHPARIGSCTRENSASANILWYKSLSAHCIGSQNFTLAVTDLSPATTFYDASGLVRRLRDLPGVSFFEAANVTLSPYPRESLEQDVEAAVPEAAGAGRITLACNVTGEAEVTDLMERALAAGGYCIQRPFRASWGGTMGYFADPDGHVGAITSAPTFTFDAQGRLVLPEDEGSGHAP